MSYDRPCSSCISTCDGYRRRRAAQCVLLKWYRKTREREPLRLILEMGNWRDLEHEEAVSLSSRVTFSLSVIPLTMAAPNYEEAAAIATEFISSSSLAQHWFPSG